jgi:hypothetical protein
VSLFDAAGWAVVFFLWILHDRRRRGRTKDDGNQSLGKHIYHLTKTQTSQRGWLMYRGIVLTRAYAGSVWLNRTNLTNLAEKPRHNSGHSELVRVWAGCAAGWVPPCSTPRFPCILIKHLTFEPLLSGRICWDRWVVYLLPN